MAIDGQNGVKSKKFGPIWTTMFLTAKCYPDKLDYENKEHLLKKKRYEIFYKSFKYTLPCKFCREFMENVLIKKYPLDFSGMIPLMHSIYIWKDQVNKKLLSQGCKFTKKSPPFNVILNRYNKLSAKCDAKKGKCI